MLRLPLRSTGIFSSVLLQYPQIMEMLITNTYGKIWMIGGGVAHIIVDHLRDPDRVPQLDYWNLCSLGEFPYRDFDFIVEEFRTDFRVSSGWEKKVNTFGGIKLVKKSPYRQQIITVDIWKLRKHEPCRRHALPFTVESVLQLTPLTVQSIIVDLREAKVLGEAGIDAILGQTVAVNHVDEAQNYARVYNTTVKEYLFKKAKEYNFTPIL